MEDNEEEEDSDEEKEVEWNTTLGDRVWVDVS